MATKDVMIAMAGANHTEGSEENNIGILTRYIKIENGWGEKAVTNPNSDWVTQLAVQNKIEKTNRDDIYIMKSLLAVEDQNKIYVLLVNYTRKKSPSETFDWQFKVAVGTVIKNKKRAWGSDCVG